MVLKLIEGYDHMSTISLLGAKGWTTTLGSSANPTNSLQTGRISGNCYRWTTGSNSGNPSFFAKTLPSALATIHCGFAFRISTQPSADRRVFELRNSTTETVQVRITSTGLIRISNSAGTTIATGTTVINTATWYFIELKVVIAGASGTVEVKLNGAAEIASTTGNFGSSSIDNIAPTVEAYGTAGVTQEYDDIYVLDTTGSDNTTFLGDVHVETIYPATDSATNDQWTPDTGTNSAARVNEHTGTYPDGDTSYIFSSTVNQKTTFDMDTLASLTGTVYGVQTNLYARKDDAATRQIAPVVRQGGSDFDGTNAALAITYSEYTQIYENDPSDSADWTISKVNSAEFGVKLTV